MTIIQARCANVNHATRRGSPGWDDGPLAVVELSGDASAFARARAAGGFICDACAAAVRSDFTRYVLELANANAAARANPNATPPVVLPPRGPFDA